MSTITMREFQPHIRPEAPSGDWTPLGGYPLIGAVIFKIRYPQYCLDCMLRYHLRFWGLLPLNLYRRIGPLGRAKGSASRPHIRPPLCEILGRPVFRANLWRRSPRWNCASLKRASSAYSKRSRCVVDRPRSTTALVSGLLHGPWMTRPGAVKLERTSGPYSLAHRWPVQITDSSSFD